MIPNGIVEIFIFYSFQLWTALKQGDYSKDDVMEVVSDFNVMENHKYKQTIKNKTKLFFCRDKMEKKLLYMYYTYIHHKMPFKKMIRNKMLLFHYLDLELTAAEVATLLVKKHGENRP